MSSAGLSGGTPLLARSPTSNKLVPLLLVREGSHRRRARRDRSSAAEAATCGGGVARLQQALSSSAGPTGPADRPALHPWPRGHLGAGATSLATRGQQVALVRPDAAR